MKLYNKLKNKLGVIALIALLFQITMPVYQGYVYATEGETGETIEEVVNDKDADSTEEQTDEDTEGDGTGEDQETEKDQSIENLNSEETEESGDDSTSGSEIQATSLIDTLAPTAEERKDLGNIFTFESFKIDGVEANENQVVDISDGTKVTLDYNWSVEKGVKVGDYAEIDVPKAFKLDRAFENQDIQLNDGTVVGKYSLINNKIKFVFDEGIEKVGQVENGFLGFKVKFNEESFEEDVVTDIEFNDKNDKTITIIGKPKVEVSAINKEGIPDSKKDAKTITWTVDLTNPSNEAIIDAKFKDILPEGLELNLDTIKVKNLNIKLDGSLSPGSGVTVGSPTIDGENFELDLPTIDPYKGYRVEYTTKITDKNISQFTNNALFKYGEEKLPADTTVTVERSADIEKYGEKVDGKDEIDWWIDVNKSGGSIDNAIVKDTLPTGVTLTSGSIEIFKLTKDEDNWTESDSDKTATVFPITLGKIDEAYRIKFKTRIDYSKVNDKNYQKDNSFTNKTVLKDGEEKEIGDAEKTVTVTPEPILTKTSNYIQKDKTIKWKVTVNEANRKIDDAVIKDRLPQGITLVDGDITIKDGKGNPVTEGITIEVEKHDGINIPLRPLVKIDLGNITEQYTIEYTTKIVDFSLDKFLNEASLTGDGIGTGWDPSPVEVNPAKNGYGKEHMGINYNQKTMSWRTITTPRWEAYKSLKITDTFPNDGLILLEDTLKIVLQSSPDRGLVKGKDYTLSPIDEEHKNGFVVEFNESALPIEDRMVMTYDTSYDPEKKY